MRALSARRDVPLFLLAALVPAAATGALGWRALRNEEAALRREAATEVTRAAERAAAQCRDDLARGGARLADEERGATASDDARELDAYERAARAAPMFAEPMVVDADARLLLPREARPSDKKAERACSDAISAFAASRAEDAKSTILSRCQDARDARGRFLWPILAIESLEDKDDASLFAKLSTWIDAHAERMRPEERAVTREELGRLDRVPAAKREAVSDVLAGTSPRSSSAAPILEAAVRKQAIADAIRSVPAGPPETLKTAGVTGAVVVLDDGARAGFIVTPETIAKALRKKSARLPGLDEGFVASVASDASAPSEEGAPVGFAWISEGIGVRVRYAQPEQLRARTTRSERILGALIAGGIALALALAFVLYRRMLATRRTSELRTSFVAGISHELRTPLASVRMLSELMAEGRIEEDERKEVAEALAREALRMQDTVERFLAYAKSERGKLLAAKKPDDLAALVRARARVFSEQHPEVKVEVEAPERAIVSIDRPQIEIVVDNLLSNALKYAPEGQPFCIAVVEGADETSLSVSDRGPGIPRAHAKRIFDAFQRGDDRLSKATSGTGLGLFLVRSIARAHGGDVSVSRPEGGGARFVVDFPREAPRAEEGR